MISVDKLQPGDVLLYNDKSLVDRLICFRTWSCVSHVEVYLGNGKSAASRNGIGVNIYPVRMEGLTFVRRPKCFHSGNAFKFLAKKAGTPYGWLDLLRFYLVKIPCKGLICSQFADLLLRQAGTIVFDPTYPAGEISPRDFLVTPRLQTVWKC